MFSRKKTTAGIHQKTLTTLIAQDMHIRGDVEFSGGLRLDGQVHGNVTSQAGSQSLLVLSERCSITGNVHGYDVIVNGTIVGDLIADHFVELQPNARVSGNICYQQLRMDCGASVEGRLMKREAAQVDVAHDSAADAPEHDASPGRTGAEPDLGDHPGPRLCAG
ncbi:hypothetical protein R75461_07881 [Paraburkholderia nemoris]|uniref:bactofilin family protein n=1 Tax=Paraburkholderia nemoris TaxID=2793076 RepID=UPI0019098181|nr:MULTISPECIES: polymer-forming cytoskeletal protein [Paraburkholderia]MBK3786913.1 polymer-forming cytoskeletal protein [Paraburkholderia aspalathi]CAE6858978.1 hypothetical protein R75461_07881 [Paraburkholderia nemoris]